MTLILSGTDGLSDVDGSAATPAIRGTDANTGIFFPAADTIAFSEGGAEAMRIDSSGNVGIGTTTMTQKLNVEGNIGTKNGGHLLSTASNTNAGGLYLDSSGSKSISLRADPDNDASGTYIGFTTDGTERARIDSSGNLLVGATSSPSIYSIATFRGANKGIAIQDSGSGVYRAIYVTAGNLYFYNGSNEGYLSSAGAWVNASDAKLKNSIVDIKYGLTAVMNTQPRSYKMNDLDGEYVGFVAQELQQIIPEVVSGDPEKQLGVDYGSLVAVAFKAIQEQQAIITQLQADVAALQAPQGTP